MVATIPAGRRERTNLRRLARAVAFSSSGEGRRIREASGVPLASLAEAIGSSPPTLSRWERGLSRPSGEAAARWVQALDELARLGGGDAA